MPLQKLTKEEIIYKSITVFRQKGYYRTNMSDLARYCGLTKGAFYHHFPSKEAVMRHCLQMTSDWFKEHIFSIGYNKDIDDQQKLIALLDIYYKTFTKEEGGCFFANTILETMQVEDTFRDISKDFFKAWEQSLEAIFTTKYPQTISKDKSIQVITQIEGAIILMLLNQDSSYLDRAIQESKKLY